MADTKDKPLTPRQKAFVEAYCGEAMLNGTRAARLAGLKGTDSVLAVAASKLVRIGKVRAAIDELLSKSIMSADEVLNRLGRHASASLADVLTDDGEFDLRDVKRKGTDDLLKKLKKRKTTRRTKDGEEIEDITYEFEIHDPQAALVHLGRYHKLFTDKTEVTGKDGAPLLGELVERLDKVWGNGNGNEETNSAD